MHHLGSSEYMALGNVSNDFHVLSKMFIEIKNNMGSVPSTLDFLVYFDEF